MKKTILASAIASTLGVATTAPAATITIEEMVFGGSYVATGTLNDAGTGQINSYDPFSFFPWTATQQNWFDTHSSTITWAGGTSTGAIGAFTYTFHLTGNQVAAGTYFDWNTNLGIPILTIFDCPVSGGGACTGNTLPMVTNPFPGAQPGFNGSTLDDFPISGGSPVPIPAAVWLFGSGLLGLIGLVRRKA